MKKCISILIVDDNKDLSENLNDILKERDYPTAVANDGQSAIKQCSKKKFELALIDLKLPDLSGLKLIKKLSVLSPLMDFIIITGHGTLDTAVEAVRQKEIIAFEVKPINMDRLLNLIQQITLRKQVEAELQASELELKIRNQILEIFLKIPDEQVYAEILQLVLKSLKSRYGTFGYLDVEGTFVVPSLTREIYWEKCQVTKKEILFKKGKFRGIWGRAIKGRKTLYDNKGPFTTPDGHISIKNTMVTPIIYKNKIISAIHIANKTTDYDEKDRQLLEIIARQIAPVLNARLERDRQEKERLRAEELLRNSEEKFRSYAKNAPDFLVQLDHDGTILFSNKTYTGVSMGEVVGSSFVDWIPDQYQTGINNVLAGVFTRAESKVVEYPALDKKGTLHWYSAHIGPIKSADQVTSAILIIREITDQKKVEKELDEYRKDLEKKVKNRTREVNLALKESENARDRIDAILKSISDGLMVTDLNHKIILMNRAIEDLLNIRLSEIMDQSVTTAFLNETIRSKIIALLSKQKSGEKCDLEIEDKINKKSKFIRVYTSLIKDRRNRKRGIITIFQDITQEREVNRMKMEFLSAAANELRTPLISIKGFSEILLTRDDLREEEKREFLDYINRQSINLGNIIKDLQDISSNESRAGLELKRQRCIIEDVLKEIDYVFELSSPGHSFKVVLPDKPTAIFADKVKIEHVLINLLSNAVKYSPDGGEIRVTGKVLKNRYTVTVKDEGIGMTPDQENKVFDKFYHANITDTDVEGIGMGMSIVKAIIKAHKGKIWVESKLGEGTKITFTLPLDLRKRKKKKSDSSIYKKQLNENDV